MSRKNHIKIDGMLIRTDKQFRHLKNSQKEKISNWLYDEYKNAYDKIGKPPDSRRNEEIVSAVYEKIEECGIWIPYYEVEKYYCSKKNKYRMACFLLHLQILALSSLLFSLRDIAYPSGQVQDMHKAQHRSHLQFQSNFTRLRLIRNR